MAALILSAIAVIYAIAWTFLGLSLLFSGTIIGFLFYALGFALAATPMVAYWLAGCVGAREMPARKGGLWGIVVMLPAGVMFMTLLREALIGPAPTQMFDVLIIFFYAVPGGLSVFLIGAFAALAWRGVVTR